MSSRMDKYYKESIMEESRTSRNKNIYDKHDEKAFEDLNLTSNISIIDADIENLDIDKLKDYLNERYKKEEKNDLQKNLETEKKEEIDLIDTKEYDLNKVIAEAHKNKESDYDKERFRKLRDTQYDILKNLKIEKDKEFEVRNLKVDDDEESINDQTVNIDSKTEQTNNEKTSETDLFADLLGSDETEKIQRIEEEPDELEEINDTEELEEDIDYKKPSLNEEIEKTIKLKKEEIIKKQEEEKDKEEITKEIKKEETKEQTNLLNNSFYTGQYQIKESDLDEFDDLKRELKTGSFLSKVLIVLLIIIILAAIVFVLDMYLHLGLFK